MISLSRFDLVSLRLFVVVVDAGSLTGGAERFGISLAAASKRIAELEHHVGTPLLARSKRGVVPTPAGSALHRHAIELVAGLEQLAVVMADYHAGTRGHVRLWANTSAVNGFLPALLAAFLAEHPGTKIDLEEALSDDVVRAVVAGAADLGVFAENTRADGVQATPCDADRLVLLMSREHALARSRRVAFAQALDHDFIGLGRSTSLMRLISGVAEAEGRALKVRVQVRSFDAMCRMVAVGLGVAVLPQAAAAPHVRSMRLHATPIDEPWGLRRLLLGFRERERLSPPARALAGLIEARGLPVGA